MPDTSTSEKSPPSSHFQRRVYQVSHEKHGSIQSTSKKAFSHLHVVAEKGILGKDTPHTPRHRDVYFPLLIKIFSLQEQIRNAQSGFHRSFPLAPSQKPLKEIQDELMNILTQIEESQRWNEAVIVKAKKALGELDHLFSSQATKSTPFSWIKKVLQLMKRRSWIKKSHQ